MPGGVSSAASSSKFDFSGDALKRTASMKAHTRTHEFSFASKQCGRFVPDFSCKYRTFRDIDDRERINAAVTSSMMGEIDSVKKFESFVAAQERAYKNYLLPEERVLLANYPSEDRSHSLYMQVTGKRLCQFYDELKSCVRETSLSEPDRSACIFEVNRACEEAFRNRVFAYDLAETGTYWSYKTGGFYLVFEKMIASLSDKDSSKIRLQSELDFLLTHCYTPKGSVLKCNIENSLELVTIDQESRARVSMTLDSEETFFPKYVTLKVRDDIDSPHAGKAVFRDGKNYYFEQAENKLDKIPAGLIRYLEENSVRDIVFRFPKESEFLRDYFKFDWDESGIVDDEPVDSSWYGKCDVRAKLQQMLLDLRNCGGHTEYNVQSEKVAAYTREDQLQAAAFVVDCCSKMKNLDGSKEIDVGQHDDAGARFEDRPEDLRIETEKGQLSFPVKLTSLSEDGYPRRETSDFESFFFEKVASDDKESFEKNPDVTVGKDTTTNYISSSERSFGFKTAPRDQIDATGELTRFGYDFVEGEIVQCCDEGRIDWSEATGERIKVASELFNAEERMIRRYYYDPVTKCMSSEVVQGVDRGLKFSEIKLQETDYGKVKSSKIGKERMRDDDALEKVTILKNAFRTGEKICLDSTWRYAQLWNGDGKKFLMVTEFEDTQFERVAIYMDATFAEASPRSYVSYGGMYFGRAGLVINKFNEHREVIETLELEPIVDFFWRDYERVMPMKMHGHERFYNSEMLRTGIIATGRANEMASLEAVWHLFDLVYLGLMAKDRQRTYSLLDGKDRYLYADQVTWRAEVERYLAWKYDKKSEVSAAGAGESSARAQKRRRSTEVSRPRWR